MSDFESSDEPLVPRQNVESQRAELAERLAFLQIDANDSERLKSLQGLLRGQMGEFVEMFYRHLLGFDSTRRFLRDPELVERLKLSQVAHFESMLDARWDAEYVARRHRVGDVHAAVGIEPPAFLGAYNQYLQFCLRTLAEHGQNVPEEFIARVGSLLKAVLLDIGLTLDAYFDQSTQALRKALDMLLQSNTELRQFAQFTSHDLKTPLATVANLCDEALDEFAAEMPEGARQLIVSARNQTFRMSSMIDELLGATLSIQSEQSPQEFASYEALAEAIDRVRPQLQEKEIKLTVSEKLPWVTGSRVRLREAFYNLLSNAAKFIDKRPGRIDVQAEIRGEECVFAFADNGPGIPPDELERIFAPFRRLPAHRDRPGFGLGLYFTRSLIEQQAGRVWAESKLGQGSRFFIAVKRAGR